MSQGQTDFSRVQSCLNQKDIAEYGRFDGEADAAQAPALPRHVPEFTTQAMPARLKGFGQRIVVAGGEQQQVSPLEAVESFDGIVGQCVG